VYDGQFALKPYEISLGQCSLALRVVVTVQFNSEIIFLLLASDRDRERKAGSTKGEAQKEHSANEHY
jgi:hypothetical protein